MIDTDYCKYRMYKYHIEDFSNHKDYHEMIAIPATAPSEKVIDEISFRIFQSLIDNL